ncbi:hypothetical protein [Chryseobacterium gwangjuense]|uniref:hypothetical protein n=1 Tax=Chryseobacterium gwangjuense TaxID=1069980 RepID=UPI001E43504C|nr:hypothetical protein [Chryseobacterium gwangjuense]MCE3075720.1 hypothetical protein [Chryseobacterium gwangjuense]
MKRKILLLLFLLLVISFISNFYIEQKLHTSFSKIKTENILDLEYRSNKNFSKNGIENIGESLQRELIKMNISKCELNVRKDYFFFFQNRVITIKNNQKYSRVNTKYLLFKSIFKIEGYESVEMKSFKNLYKQKNSQ